MAPVWLPRSGLGPREPHLLPTARSALLLKHQLTLAGRPPAADSGAALASWLQGQFPYEGRLPWVGQAEGSECPGLWEAASTLEAQ